MEINEKIVKNIVKNASSIIVLNVNKQDCSGLSYEAYENCMDALIKSKEGGLYKIELVDKKDEEYEVARVVGITVRDMRASELVYARECCECDDEETINKLEQIVRELFNYIEKNGIDAEHYLTEILSKSSTND